MTQVNNVIDKKPYLCYRWELYRLTTNRDRLTLELLNEKPLLTLCGFIYLTCPLRFNSSLVLTGDGEQWREKRADSACLSFMLFRFSFLALTLKKNKRL